MLLTAFSLVLVLVTLPFSLCVSVKVSPLPSFALQLSVGSTIVYPKKFLDHITSKVHQVPSMVAISHFFWQVVQEYERAVVFRLGRLRSGGAKGPGLFFIMPCVDSYKKVDLRTVSFDVPPQEVS